MGRAPCCDKANVKRGPWSPEEDETLKNYIKRHGTVGNWIALPKKAGLNRCGKSCRLRWLNYLRPDIKHGGFTEDEDNIIWSLYNKIGSRWSVIASQLPGRTDNDVKNYWNTKLKKRLLAHQNNKQVSISSTTATTKAAFTDTNSAISTLINTPSLSPLIIPTVKTETYTCDDFLAPTLAGSTSCTGLGFGSVFNQESLLVENSCGFFSDELLISSFYETKPHGYS